MGTRTVVIAAVIAGLSLRLLFAFGYWVGKPLTLDEQEYLLLASSVARGAGLAYPDTGVQRQARHFERPPVFAVLLAGMLRLTHDPLVTAPAGPDGVPVGFPRSSSDVPTSLKILQSIIGAAVVALVAALAGHAAGRAAGAAAALLAAIYPPMVWLSGYVLSEPLYSLLALTVVWLLHAYDRPGDNGTRAPSTWLVFGAGIVCGIGVLTKEHLVFFLPLAAAWLLVRRGAVPALVLVLAAGLAVTPWVARNYAVHGRFVLTASHGGVTFWTGNNSLARGEGDLAANPDMGRARVAFEESRKGLTAQQLDNEYYRDAIGFIRAQPGAWAALVARKLFYTFVPLGPSYRLHSARYFVTTLVSYGAVLALGVGGLLSLARRRRVARLAALWLLALSTVVVCIVFFPQERFRIPVLDPALVVLAASFLGSRFAQYRPVVHQV